MKARILLLIFLSLILTTAVPAMAGTETVAGLPLHIQKFDSGAIRVWIGDHVSSTATVAIPTEKGLIIIDTTGFPEVDRELRGIIARELGRDDFKVLINTHEHGDHTGGNSVYADCTIVGHELVAAGMEQSPEGRQRSIDWLTTRIGDLEAEIAAMAADAPEAGRSREDLILKRLMLKVNLSDETPVPPTKTFTDRLVMDFGDATFELYYIGGMHSASDIAILVPEHGLLMTGDTMADIWLTDTPGCLASFIARPGVTHDFPLLLKNWNALIARQDDIKTLVTGHWNGELTFAGFENRIKYVEELWQGANEAVAVNSNLQELLTGYRLDTKFPDLVDSPGCSQGNTFTTLMEMWSTLTGQEPAAPALYALIDEGADESAIRNIVAQHGAESPTHYFDESQVNVYGYRFVQMEKPVQAAAMFRINVELYPESWNAYDSLGEALFMNGENEKAVAMYEKSLELNPENTNGKTMLERIREVASVN